MLQIEEGTTRHVRLIARDTDDVFEASVRREDDRYEAQPIRGSSPHAAAWGPSIEQAVEGLDFKDSDGETVDANRISHCEFV